MFKRSVQQIKPLLWLHARIRRLSIRNKILFGYGLAVGIAVLGTLTGLAMGDHYESKALQRRRFATQEKRFLTELNLAVFNARFHQQYLIPLLTDVPAFKREHHHLISQIAEIDRLLAQLRSRIHGTKRAPANMFAMRSLLRTYDSTIYIYWRNLETLLTRLDPAQLTPAQLPAAQQRLMAFVNDESLIQFEQLSNQLKLLVETAETYETDAELALDYARALRLQIITVSVVLAMLMAGACGLYISREIASPLQAATQIAKQAIAQTNFKLQAPVLTDDEVGSLTVSLNQLIQWVDEYTEELNLIRHNLEQRVQDRTKQLVQKHQQVQQAHEQLSQTLTELQMAQMQLVQSEKMSSLGQLVAGVAHEINNPVNFIYGNLRHAEEYMRDLLGLIHTYQMHYPQPLPDVQAEMEAIDLEFLVEDFPKLLSSTKVGAERIQGIVMSLRTFSRMDESDMKTVDIHDGIESTLMILQARFKAKPHRPAIGLTKDYGQLPMVECYAGQLNQVFMNILANALDALEERDHHRSLAEMEAMPSAITIRTTKVGGDRVMISIQDNGPGIPESLQLRLFDPFFTTKAVGKGTGLGLSISYQIITDKHGGDLRCQSIPNHGTEFQIEIPIHQHPRPTT